MNDPLVCWSVLLILLALGTYQGLEKPKRFMNAHKICSIFRAHNLAFIFLLWFFYRTFKDIVLFDFIKFHFLNSDIFQANLNDIPEDLYSLNSYKALKWFSLGSPFAGLAGFAVATYHYWDTHPVKCSCLGKGTATTEAPVDDKIAQQEFMRRVVIGMPLVFIIMSMSATIRIWAILTGSCWNDHMRQQYQDLPKEKQWTLIRDAEIATYKQDLEVAAGFQFFAVGCFAVVCQQAFDVLISNPAHEADKKWLLIVSMLGMWSFVALGVIKTTINVGCSAFSVLRVDWKDNIDKYQGLFLDRFNAFCLLTTVLSVINMLLIGKLKAVKSTLGNVNLKFNATRVLLIIGQGQQLVLLLFVRDKNHPAKIQEKVPFIKDWVWQFSEYQACLLNSSLLCYECLVVVCLNKWAWPRREVEGWRNTREPLLDNNVARPPP